VRKAYYVYVWRKYVLVFAAYAWTFATLTKLHRQLLNCMKPA
jgi:hypothetical protein